MPYASGETPVVGDYVKNKWGQRGLAGSDSQAPHVRTVVDKAFTT
jgi:hypothetical protein